MVRMRGVGFLEESIGTEPPFCGGSSQVLGKEIFRKGWILINGGRQGLCIFWVNELMGVGPSRSLFRRFLGWYQIKSLP